MSTRVRRAGPAPGGPAPAHRRRPLPRRPRARRARRPRSCAARTPTPGSSTSTSTDACEVDGVVGDLHLRGPRPAGSPSRCPLLIPHPALHPRRAPATPWPRTRSTTSARPSSWSSPATGTSPRTRPSGSGSTYEMLPVVVGIEAARAAGAPGPRRRARQRRARTCSRRSATSRPRWPPPRTGSTSTSTIERSACMPMEGKGVYARWDTDEGRCACTPRPRRRPACARPSPPSSGMPLDEGRVRRARRGRRLRRQDHAPVARGGARARGRRRSLGREVKWTEDRREHFVVQRARARAAAGGHRRLRRRRASCSPSTCGSGTTTAPTRRTASSSRSSRRPSCSGRTSPAPTASSSGRSTRTPCS